jgi:hypothetical protein
MSFSAVSASQGLLSELASAIGNFDPVDTESKHEAPEWVPSSKESGARLRQRSIPLTKFGDIAVTKPGWYEDPDDSSSLRWWSGTVWGPRHSKEDGPPPNINAVSAAEASEGEKLAKNVNRSLGLVFPIMALLFLITVILAVM